jgi:hypothetical protein
VAVDVTVMASEPDAAVYCPHQTSVSWLTSELYRLARPGESDDHDDIVSVDEVRGRGTAPGTRGTDRDPGRVGVGAAEASASARCGGSRVSEEEQGRGPHQYDEREGDGGPLLNHRYHHS